MQTNPAVDNHGSQTASCVAGVLAGGSSRRMGRPKAWIQLLDGTTFVERIVEVAHRVAGEVVILGAGADIPETLQSLPVLQDAKPEAGPLAGLCSLLEYAARRWVLLLACDLPHLQPSLLQTLCSRADESVDAIAFLRGTEPAVYHACCAAYHPRILHVVREELGSGKGSLQKILSRIRVAGLQPNAEERHQLVNVNTPGDLVAAHRQPGAPRKIQDQERRPIHIQRC